MSQPKTFPYYRASISSDIISNFFEKIIENRSSKNKKIVKPKNLSKRKT